MQACTFRLGSHVIAIPTTDIREVVLPRPITPTPGALPFVRGLTNLRGEILVAIDLHQRAGVSEPVDLETALQVVLTATHGPVLFLVDAVGDMVTLPEPPPKETEDLADTPFSSAALTEDGEEVLLIDVAQASGSTLRSPEKGG